MTRPEDLFSVFYTFCGEIAIQLVDASCGFKHQWRLTKGFDIKNRQRRLRMGLTLHPAYNPLVTFPMACLTRSICHHTELNVYSCLQWRHHSDRLDCPYTLLLADWKGSLCARGGT